MRAALVTVMIFFMNFYQLRTSAAENSNKTLYEDNLRRCQAVKCGPPQPRIVSYKEIFDQHELHPCEKVYPKVAVLHRCDNTTGYCDSTSDCEPTTMHEVPIGFMVSVKHTSGGCRSFTNQDANRYVHAVALNHTICACRKKDVKPRK